MVHDHFGGGQIRCVGAHIEGIDDEIAAGGEACAFGLRFLWAVVTDDTAIGYCSIGGDSGFRNKEDGVCALDTIGHSLGKTTEFVREGTSPSRFCFGMDREGPVLHHFAGVPV